MNEEKKYAEEWDKSAKFFYDQGYYSWMTQKIEKMHTVIEVGCGTGYSTLALVENGHKVIAIDKNHDCIVRAKQLLTDKGFIENNVIFVEGDIVEDDFRNSLTSEYDYDVVLCWNVGSYWSKSMLEYYLPYIFEYGLDKDQIKKNPESSYSELIIWNTCRLAKEKQAAIHIIDRNVEIINEQNDQYYKLLKDDFSYTKIIYDDKEALSKSKGGRKLVINGVVNNEEIEDIVLVSILIF